MLGWLKEAIEVIGVYVNAFNDIVVVCQEGFYWYHDDIEKHVAYTAIKSVERPAEDHKRELTVQLYDSEAPLLLPVLHDTEDFADIDVMYEFLWHAIHVTPPRMKLTEIDSRDDFVYFLKQPSISTAGFANLASWLEGGEPCVVWLESVGIESRTLDDPNVWKLMALLLLRFPEIAY